MMTNRVVPTTRAIAWICQVSDDVVRDWQRRGIIGRVCNTEDHKVGYDVRACLLARDSLRSTRPRRLAA